ncbi:DNA-binding MarR family transcriptional regulator [Paenibacillus shirakamiensis]|uniref:DNA-binding MarR family transcriptional regulator n=1 Tax=Paenibacillus shirakamiensis TaxID=1265935 RepID=A0ABS4JG23_9BACL|nr:MarR family transcriptional regulator [Paenibacillus shirakamiensis]MBP2000663.1 DNA-binding MarR family transcriptional regulator [Paenibacillus shirakamiensis]
MSFNLDQHPLGFMLSRTYLSFKKVASKAMNEYDVTPEQYGMLHKLSLGEGISQKKLAELIGRDQTSTGKILDKLEHKEMLIRAEDPTDRRAFLLYLSSTGRDVVEKVAPLMDQFHAQAFHGLTEIEKEMFADLINRIYDNLQ